MLKVEWKAPLHFRNSPDQVWRSCKLWSDSSRFYRPQKRLIRFVYPDSLLTRNPWKCQDGRTDRPTAEPLTLTERVVKPSKNRFPECLVSANLWFGTLNISAFWSKFQRTATGLNKTGINAKDAALFGLSVDTFSINNSFSFRLIKSHQQRYSSWVLCKLCKLSYLIQGWSHIII